LKKLADLVKDDGDGRKNVVVVALIEKNVQVEVEFDTQAELNGKEPQMVGL